MSSPRQVAIDFCPESAFRYLDRDAIICVDVLTTTTTLVTAVAAGWQVVLGGTAAASAVKALHPIMMGDAAESDCPDSPTAVAARDDRHRPLVLAMGDGLNLLNNACGGPVVYVASLRNLTATAEHVSCLHRRVAILGACSVGVMLCEDQMAVSRLAAMLRSLGFEPEGLGVAEIVERWSSAEIALARLGASAEQLRRRGREADLEFAFSHIDDLDMVCRVENSEVVSVEPAMAQRVVGSAWSPVARRVVRPRQAAVSRARRMR